MGFTSPSTPTDPYGFWISKADGSEARNFLHIHLPKVLPDATAKKVVHEFQMDEGQNHPGYMVRDVRKIDLSHYEFPIDLGAVKVVDLDWLQTIYAEERQVLISWKTGLRVYAVFQDGGCIPHQYSLNVREFGWIELNFHLVGQTSTTFSAVAESES